MKNLLGKIIIFGLFVFLIVFLTEQNKINHKNEKIKRVSGTLLDSLESAKNELILVLGDDNTLKDNIKNLSLSYEGCGSNLSILPDFLYSKKKSAIQVCNVNLLTQTTNFHQRIIYEYLTHNDLCLDPVSETLQRICRDRDENEKYVVNRALANHDKAVNNLLTLNIEYGDKNSVFMVLTGNQNKMAYKTNYGEERVVQLAAEDITYLSAQLKSIKKKFEKPACHRRVIRLFAKNSRGQNFRSFACIEDLDPNTQSLLKLSRTVSSLSKNTF